MSGRRTAAPSRRTGARNARRNGRGRVLVWPAGPRLQRCFVRATYKRNRGGASWAEHGRYLAREGAQREGAIGRGFSSDRDDVDLTSLLRHWQRAGDPWVWKFIISPERAERLDLCAHTRTLVAQMERDLGTTLEWAAIDHHNGANAHVHLVVRGRDAGARPLEIVPTYLTSGVRMRSQELATRVLGFRSERQQLAARGRPVELAKLTEIDRGLLRRVDDRGLVSCEKAHPSTPYGELTRSQDLRRLRFLERLGLAEKTGDHTWQLAATLRSALQHAHADYIRLRFERRRDISDRRVPSVAATVTRASEHDATIGHSRSVDDSREQRREHAR